MDNLRKLPDPDTVVSTQSGGVEEQKTIENRALLQEILQIISGIRVDGNQKETIVEFEVRGKKVVLFYNQSLQNLTPVGLNSPDVHLSPDNLYRGFVDGEELPFEYMNLLHNKYFEAVKEREKQSFMMLQRQRVENTRPLLRGIL